MKLNQLFCKHIWADDGPPKYLRTEKHYNSDDPINIFDEFNIYLHKQYCTKCNKKQEREKWELA